MSASSGVLALSRLAWLALALSMPSKAMAVKPSRIISSRGKKGAAARSSTASSAEPRKVRRIPEAKQNRNVIHP